MLPRKLSTRQAPSIQYTQMLMRAIEASSVIKRMKDKAFARTVSRDDLRNGAAGLGRSLEAHAANVIAFMRGQAELLGLRGNL